MAEVGTKIAGNFTTINFFYLSKSSSDPSSHRILAMKTLHIIAVNPLAENADH